MDKKTSKAKKNDVAKAKLKAKPAKEKKEIKKFKKQPKKEKVENPVEKKIDKKKKTEKPQVELKEKASPLKKQKPSEKIIPTSKEMTEKELQKMIDNAPETTEQSAISHVKRTHQDHSAVNELNLMKDYGRMMMEVINEHWTMKNRNSVPLHIVQDVIAKASQEYQYEISYVSGGKAFIIIKSGDKEVQVPEEAFQLD